ncbi:MAG: DNA polymerase, partial [Miltoncostaeaceae bacterium]
AEEAGVAVRAEGAGEDACRAAEASAAVAALRPLQEARMADEGLEDLFHQVEMPLVGVLVAMENAGVGIDVGRLATTRTAVCAEIDELTTRIHNLAGGPFTIDSTDRRVLRDLADRHEIVPLVMRYRELVKLDSTYLAALPDLVDPADGRIHTTFNQTVAETGRLSSVNPNLQNIPVRTEAGREIRDAFIPASGTVLMSFDYSQVELRILAHCSGEPALRQAFAEGRDVHAATASEVFGVPVDDMPREVRDRAKAVNFGIIYGISDFGLSEQLGIPRSEAREYIDAYLARYPRVGEFVAQTIAQATEDGYVTTLLGRRRDIPELKGRTQQQRQLGERLAVNTVIQGSAADIIKVAMIRAANALAAEPTAARLVLQIHDELLVECPPEDVDGVQRAIADAMTGAYGLNPPLAVDVGVGDTWLQAKA